MRQPNAPTAEASNTAPTAMSAKSGVPDVGLPPVCAPPSGNAIVVGVTNALTSAVVAVVAGTVVVAAATVVVVPTAAPVVVVAAAAVVVVAATVVVVVAATVVVVVVATGGGAQPTWVIVLLFIVTAPLRASALPEIVAPFCRLMDVRARMVPRKVVLANRSAELPTCQ